MALLILIHDTNEKDDSGEPIGMVSEKKDEGFYWENWESDGDSEGGGYPTVEEALRDLLDELGFIDG